MNKNSNKRTRCIDSHVSVVIYMGSASFGQLVCARYTESLAKKTAAAARDQMLGDNRSVRRFHLRPGVNQIRLCGDCRPVPLRTSAQPAEFRWA